MAVRRVLARSLVAALGLLLVSLPGGRAQGVLGSLVGLPAVQDIFGRTLSAANGIQLVDWDGPIANPAIRLFITPPGNLAFPVRIDLAANGDRLYFDLPSSIGPNGPSKTVTFDTPSTVVPIYLSIFSNRGGGGDESYALTLDVTDALGAHTQSQLTIRVRVQPDRLPAPFQVPVDVSRDQTGFFDDRHARAVVQQAADDWAYFIADMRLVEVPAGEELTFIFDPDGFVSGSYTTNDRPYRNFLAYVYGIHSAELRSGGEASFAGGRLPAAGYRPGAPALSRNAEPAGGRRRAPLLPYAAGERRRAGL
jgi:hypothetical protein